MKAHLQLLILLILSGLAAFGSPGMLAQDSSEPSNAQLASVTHHPVVPAFERFREVQTIDDVERGRLLINELNCAACHQAESQVWSVEAKQAPILSELGSRVRPEYLIRYLADPHGVKPGTTMPDLLASRSAAEKQQIAEALAHFLATTGKTSDTPPMPGPISSGEKLFHSIGCVACHDPQNEATRLATSVPLGDLAAKYTIPGLTQFLRNPLSIRPSGRMPHLGLSDNEARDIAHYLLKDIDVQANIRVAVYHGSWDNLPDFDQLEPVSTGTVPVISPAVAERKDDFGLVFTGYWEVNRAGKYNFKISSDDGSRLLINGDVVIDNDGVHANQTKAGSRELKPGIHEVRIEYFEKGGEEVLNCEVNGPELPNQAFNGLLRATREPPADRKQFVLEPAKAEQGSQYFVSVGCANCHPLKTEDTTYAAVELSKTAMSQLTGEGCITGAGTVPIFGFDTTQQAALVAALKAEAEPEFDAAARIHHRFATLNCYACHERNALGGVVDLRGDSDEVYGREKWFTSDQPEMGDEGRLPPWLTGVGAKLNPTWLAAVLDNNAKERPYMATRMPRFGTANLGTLVDDLIKEDQLSDPVKVEFDQSPRKIKSIGRAFAGTNEKENGLSCIKCHTFGDYQATGIQAISLTSMSKRLNRDWFLKYMLKPSRFRPGTRMPESWPGGKSFFPDVLDGDPHKQIAAIWEYLSDGEKADKPKGLIQARMQIVATDTPRIYRNFIEGAGPRAIGVGYPSELNLAFDANNSRLAMIWTGAFIDAARHWTGRGQGFQPPLGDNVLKFAPEVAFATPEAAATSWPKQSGKELGLRFKGYRFDAARRPIFMYQLNDVQISDAIQPRPTPERYVFERTLQLESTETPTIWYRAAVGSTIEKVDDTTFAIANDYRIRLSENVETEIRSVGNQQELIVKIKLRDGRAELTQQYIW